MTDTSLQCDFCSAPSPVWRYPARSFVAYCVPNVAGESVGIGRRATSATC